MNNRYYKAKIAKNFIRVIDIILVVILFVYIREYQLFGHFVDKTTFSRIAFSLWHLIALIMLSFLWNRIFTYMGMYDFRKQTSLSKEISQVVLASSIGVACLIFCAELIGMTGLEREFSIVFLGATLFTFLHYRLLLYYVLFIIRKKKRNIRYVVIAGLNKRSVAIYRKLSRSELGINVLGFIDDKSRQSMYEDIEKSVLCSIHEFDEYISKNPVDEVIVAFPMRSFYDEIARIIETCAIQGIKSRLVTDFFDLPSNIPFNIDSEDPTAAINYMPESLTEFQSDMKRLLDLAVSTTAILLLLPVFLVVAIIIMIDDGCPVIFAQERIGYNKRRFKVFKFRTMVRDAEKLQAALEAQNEMNGATFKITKDPRIIKSGNFLRRSSLDELPQLWNVFLGSMSLVGPRPLPVRDFEKFYNSSHRRRFSIKPGITGLWQVSGRNDIDFEEWMKLDLHYIDNWSPLLELKILLWTIPAIFSGRGAK